MRESSVAAAAQSRQAAQKHAGAHPSRWPFPAASRNLLSSYTQLCGECCHTPPTRPRTLFQTRPPDDERSPAQLSTKLRSSTSQARSTGSVKFKEQPRQMRSEAARALRSGPVLCLKVLWMEVNSGGLPTSGERQEALHRGTTLDWGAITIRSIYRSITSPSRWRHVGFLNF